MRQPWAFSASPTAQEISRARVFEEPLVPVGGEPTTAENAALAATLLGYAKRNGPDDFATLTDFLERYPQSPWRAAFDAGPAMVVGLARSSINGQATDAHQWLVNVTLLGE